VTTFVDSSALFAVLDSDDVNNDRATTTFASLGSRRESLITHSYVALETTALVQRRLGLDAVRTLLDDLLPTVVVHWVDERLHRAATAALLAAARRDVSLVDWTSFELMRRTGTTRAFSFDADFEAQGFELVG
jgi:uncharacterized protein